MGLKDIIVAGLAGYQPYLLLPGCYVWNKVMSELKSYRGCQELPGTRRPGSDIQKEVFLVMGIYTLSLFRENVRVYCSAILSVV